MKKGVNELIPSEYFPADGVSDAEKETDSFGLKIGRAIQHEWFGSGVANRFYNQWDTFHRRRMYARGEQPTEDYKNSISFEGDLSYMNLDFTNVPIIPKFIDIIVNGMTERMFTPKAYAQDPMSLELREEFRRTLEGQRVAKDVLDVIQQSTGVNPFIMDPNEMPEDDEQIALHMQLKYKPGIEIAEELAIKSVFDENDYNDIAPLSYYDQAVLGIAVGMHDFVHGKGVVIKRVDPAKVVYSYTEDPYFRDCFYWGYVENMHLTDLYAMDPTLGRPEGAKKLERIRHASKMWRRDISSAHSRGDGAFNGETCDVLFFDYKTTKRFVFKKKILDTGSRMIAKDDSFDPPDEVMEEGRFEMVDKTIEVWYRGAMILGTDILLEWELAENMVRPESASGKAIPRFVAAAPRMYKGNIDSLCQRMIPFADQIQLTHLKIQQVTNRIVPDGVFIDADGINEVDLGDGGSYSPKDALRLYFQTGSVVGRSFTQEGEFNNAKVPVQPLSGGAGNNKFQTLVGVYNHYLDMIRTVTGLNEARDASTPDPDSLVGLQKLAALNSNIATRHILDAGLYIYKELAKAISYRVADILSYSDFREEFIAKLGRYNTAALEDIKHLHLHSFGINIEVSPDEEERSHLEKNIQAALSKGDINIEDAVDVREIRNIKIANQLLKVKRNKNVKAQRAHEEHMERVRSEGQMQQRQLESQLKQEDMMLDTQSKMQVKQAEVAFDIEKIEIEGQVKAQLMAQKFEYDMQLRQLEVGANMSKKQIEEEEKARRISQQSSEQSELISQRQNNLPPRRFSPKVELLPDIGRSLI